MKHVTLCIVGEIEENWSDWFDGLRLTQGVEGQTIVKGFLPDMSAVHGLLGKLQNLGLEIVSVQIETTNSEEEEQ